MMPGNLFQGQSLTAIFLYKGFIQLLIIGIGQNNLSFQGLTQVVIKYSGYGTIHHPGNRNNHLFNFLGTDPSTARL